MLAAPVHNIKLACLVNRLSPPLVRFRPVAKSSAARKECRRRTSRRGNNRRSWELEAPARIKKRLQVCFSLANCTCKQAGRSNVYIARGLHRSGWCPCNKLFAESRLLSVAIHSVRLLRQVVHVTIPEMKQMHVKFPYAQATARLVKCFPDLLSLETDNYTNKQHQDT